MPDFTPMFEQPDPAPEEVPDVGPVRAVSDPAEFQRIAQEAYDKADVETRAWARAVRSRLEAEWWSQSSPAPPMDALDRAILIKTAAHPGWMTADTVAEPLRDIVRLRVLLHRRNGSMVPREPSRVAVRADFEAWWPTVSPKLDDKDRIVFALLLDLHRQPGGNAKRLAADLPPTKKEAMERAWNLKIGQRRVANAITLCRNTRLLHHPWGHLLTRSGQALVRTLYGVEARPQWWTEGHDEQPNEPPA